MCGIADCSSKPAEHGKGITTTAPSDAAKCLEHAVPDVQPNIGLDNPANRSRR
jgi:hypothetical protein